MRKIDIQLPRIPLTPPKPRGLPGLDLLVNGLFDYAGMFPPAKLDLDVALCESARFPRTLRRPALVAADLVVPLDRLADVTRPAVRQAGFAESRCSLCVVGVEASQLDAAVATVTAFNAAHEPFIAVTALEVHGDSFRAAAVLRARDALGHVRLFLEPKWTPGMWSRKLPTLLALLEKAKISGPSVGLKVRGVGPTAVSRAALTKILPGVAALPVPFKATQGLHHPFVGDGNDLGFLNLVAALRLGQLRTLTSKELTALLANRSAHGFSFLDGLAWGGHSLSLAELRLARADLPFTIGSCSLSEPDEDLAHLFDA